jgi:chromosome segregation ATPase
MSPHELRKELEALERKCNQLHASVTACENTMLQELRAATARLELTRLQTEIEMVKRDIATFTEVARLRGDVPNIDGFCQRLTQLRGELEEFQARHGLESRQLKRWWQFWRT